MKYKLALFLRFLTGFLFYLLFFIASYKSIVTGQLQIMYLFSFVAALVYLYFSYLVSHYHMHYFFEFLKELILKLILIVSMYGFVAFVYFCFPLAINSGSRGLVFLVFGALYIAFDFISDLAIVTSSYRKAVEVSKYHSKMAKIANYEEQMMDEQNEFERQEFIENQQRIKKSSKFFSRYISLCVYDCFIDHEIECYGIYDKAFYMKLIEFSKENQRFFGKKLGDNKNYILDCRCNIICINDTFSFVDHNGSKCVITKKINKEYF